MILGYDAGQVKELEVPVKSDGTVLGIKARFICDMGAYLQLFTPAIPGFSGLMMSGCHKIPAVSNRARTRGFQEILRDVRKLVD